MHLSVLDLAPIREGGTARDAINESIKLAKRVDALGYHRYWFGEHHNSGDIATSAPEVLIARIAADTERLRVGSGGVMLAHYAALKVAEQFQTLEALYPGRIDLGVGRASGTDAVTAQALSQWTDTSPMERYPRQVLDLMHYLEGELPAGHPFHEVHATPAVEGIPEVWMLGSSSGSATLAAEFGLPLSFAHFINGPGAAPAVILYRERFKPSRWLDRPRVNIAVEAIAVDSAEEVERLTWSHHGMRYRRARGLDGVPSPEDAREYDYTRKELDQMAQAGKTLAIGEPQLVHDRLLKIATELDVDELIILTTTYAYEARERSYELLAEAFELDSDVQDAG